MRAFSVAILSGVLFVASGCADEVGCVTNADCASGLACIEQRCRALLSSDGGDGDAGAECTVGVTVCPGGTECRPVAGDACERGGPGRCTTPIATGVMPECGCDGWSYMNATRRVAAGAAFAHDGFCTCDECAPGGLCDGGWGCSSLAPTAGVCVEMPATCPNVTAELGWSCPGGMGRTYMNECRRLMAGEATVSSVPTCPSDVSGGCCFDDDDCTLPARCYGSTGCTAGQEGACLSAPATAGACYGTRDCQPGYRCEGSMGIDCDGDTAPIAGTCEPRPEGLR